MPWLGKFSEPGPSNCAPCCHAKSRPVRCARPGHLTPQQWRATWLHLPPVSGAQSAARWRRRRPPPAGLPRRPWLARPTSWSGFPERHRALSSGPTPPWFARRSAPAPFAQGLSIRPEMNGTSRDSRQSFATRCFDLSRLRQRLSEHRTTV
jgi:hypothetical protein